MRPIVVRVFAAIGTVALFFGAIYAWASPTLFDSDKFAARARHSLEESASLRRVVARTLVVDGIERQQPDLIRFRPILISAAESVVGTDAFGDVFELAVRHAHQFFTEEPTDNIVVRANEAALLLIDTVRKVAPEVADAIPLNVNGTLIRIRDHSNELGLWRRADRVHALGTILPIIGVVAWAIAVALASDRRKLLVRLGVALTVMGVVLLVALRIGGRVFAGQFDLPLNQSAARDVWDHYVDGLQALAWFGVFAGVIVAAAVQATSDAASRLSPARIRTIVTGAAAREPRSTVGKAVAAIAVMALGVAMFGSPLDVAAALVTVLGAFVFYAGLVFLLDLVSQPVPAGADRPRSHTWAIGVAGALGVILVLAVSAYLVLSSPAAVGGLQDCNGRIEYCALRLNEIALPTTHNSMTAAEDGFLLPNQERGIAKQLRDGVRGFQLDAYLGSVQSGGGLSVVFTDLSDDKLLTIEDAVGPDLAAQALQFRAVVGPPPASAQQDVYLCHNFCELGAVKMREEVDTFRRFLERNPTDVLFFVIQDELPADRLAEVLHEGGLDRYVATIDPTQPLPRLGSMIASGRRVVITLENGDLGPRIPNAFSDGIVQEVPYNYRTIDQLGAPGSCVPLRGSPDAPLFQFNHWVTPASLSAARQVNTAAILGARAETCREVRGLQPNLVAVDFYETGDLFSVVEQLNATR